MKYLLPHLYEIKIFQSKVCITVFQEISDMILSVIEILMNSFVLNIAFVLNKQISYKLSLLFHDTMWYLGTKIMLLYVKR
jgi:hypothetical protein